MPFVGIILLTFPNQKSKFLENLLSPGLLIGFGLVYGRFYTVLECDVITYLNIVISVSRLTFQSNCEECFLFFTGCWFSVWLPARLYIFEDIKIYSHLSPTIWVRSNIPYKFRNYLAVSKCASFCYYYILINVTKLMGWSSTCQPSPKHMPWLRTMHAYTWLGAS